MNIMSIDDSSTIRKIIRISMSDMDDVNIVEAENGVDALEKLEGDNTDINLFIVDINMPKMNGLEFIKSIKKDVKYSKYLKTPIIILTTEKEHEMKKKGFELGADAWTVKPFDPKDFKVIVKRLLNN
jgi:two-component system chemotaxis response regulator CheY